MRALACAVLLLVLPACGDRGDADADAGAAVEPSPPASSPPASGGSDEPSPSSAPSPTASPSPAALGEPRTDVPASVLLTPALDVTRETDQVGGWSLRYCGPESHVPAASAMRSRSFAGPPAGQEVGRLRYTQQVAAFPTVEEAVAEARILLAAAQQCQEDDGGAGPHVTDLPVGVQSRLIVFAEGGDFSIGGFFRRGNAVAVVQGEGGEADTAVREALRTTFDRMCVFDRPEGC